MRFIIRKIPLYIFIAFNIVLVVAMNLCAYATTLNSNTYPEYSHLGMLFPLFLTGSAAFIVFWLIFKRRCMLISIIGMALCGSSIRTYIPLNYPSAPPEGSIKVMSYNVMNFGKHDSIPWDENYIVQYINWSGADIVCLQEGGNTKGTTVFEMFDSIYPHIVVDSVKNAPHLILLSKYPVLSSQRIEYESETNASFAHTLLMGSDTLLVVNNHFESYKLKDKDKDDYKTIIKDPEDDANEQRYDSLVFKLNAANAIRALQADTVARFIEQSTCRYILCVGDFNDPSLSYTHYRLTRHLNDAYTRSGNGPGFSYNRSGMYFRIDHILTSPNITSYKTKVDCYSRMSDHYPIISYLKFGDK